MTIHYRKDHNARRIIAEICARIAANRSMRIGGRTNWNETDFAVAISTFDRIAG